MYIRIFSIFIISIFNIYCLYLGAQTHSSSVSSNKAYKTVALSLRQILRLSEEGKSNSDTDNLAYLNEIQGYVIDAVNHDIILIGRYIPSKPLITIDELAVEISNIYNRQQAPFCSIEPYRENYLQFEQYLNISSFCLDQNSIENFIRGISNTLGNQKVVVGGVPSASRHAHIMLDADYLMKRLCMGKTTNKSIKNLMDIMAEIAESSGKPLQTQAPTISRFWFHISSGSPTYKAASKIVIVDSCRIELLTERQKQNRDGSLIDSNETDPAAIAYAKYHSTQFKQLTDRYTQYAALENLFFLYAILKALHFRNDAAYVNLSLEFFTQNYSLRFPKPLPNEKPNLTNYNLYHRQSVDKRTQGDVLITEYYLPIVIGGVSLQMIVDESKFTYDEELDALAEKVLATRPSPDSLSWSFDENE